MTWVQPLPVPIASPLLSKSPSMMRINKKKYANLTKCDLFLFVPAVIETMNPNEGFQFLVITYTY